MADAKETSRTAHERDTEQREPEADRTEAGRPEQPRSVYRGTGVVPALIAGLLLAAAIVAFVAQNADAIALEWLWLDFETSPAVLVLATLLLAVVADEVLGLVWRRARRRRLAEREEVEQLRSARDTGDTP